jgi:furin
MGQGKI